jgi:glycerate kinase
MSNATLEAGVEIVAEAVGLPKRLGGADLCITGEGKFDSQSNAGKTAVGVAKFAKLAGVPVICIPGQATPDAPHELFAAVVPLVGGEVELDHALANPQAFLQRRARQAMKNFMEKGS